MPVGAGVFAILPPQFFSPLARANREHYAALLVLYFRLFQESSGKLERELVVRSFTDYLGRHREALVPENSDDDTFDGAGETGTDRDTETPYFDFGGRPAVSESREAGDEVPGLSSAEDSGSDVSFQGDREAANKFLRRLIRAGWLGEETLPDYTRVINITPHARPFFEALARVDEGLKAEYESHVVAIYSLLCGDAVEENGHYAVLNAHSATTALIDSLKVLSQSIKGHYDRFTAEAAASEVKGILHLHYDIYAAEILDGAYKQLKTSDNLSRYRPRIQKKVGELMGSETWLAESARKYSRISAMTREESRSRLAAMLEEIRDTLRAVDPLLDDIDRRNMLYARSSIERIKALLEPDSTLAGKLGSLVRELYTAGHPNRAVRALLSVLAGSGFLFYHAGDLDIDGILILQELTDIAGKPVMPVKMDRKTFEQYRCHGRKLEASMLRRISLISEATRKLPGMMELIGLIEKTGLGVEQEIIDYQ
jgi:hypothetical protein